MKKKIRKKPSAQVFKPLESEPVLIRTVQPASSRNQQLVRIGSDCSGLCPEFLAARDVLFNDISHEFANDNNRSVRKFIQHFMPPRIMQCDIFTRNLLDLKERLSLYSAGFPCDTFTKNGKQLGLRDLRGQVLYYVLSFIEMKSPDSFILENVAALATDFKALFHEIIQFLRALSDGSGLRYNIYHMIIDTKTHGALPQSRKRIYIVGVKRTQMVRPFRFPQEVPMKTLKQVLPMGTPSNNMQLSSHTFLQNIAKSLEALKRAKHDIVSEDFIIDVGGSEPHASLDISPCITRTRAGARGYYSTLRNRMLTIDDMMILQGYDPEEFRGWSQVVSPRQMGMMLGNAMTRSVMERLVRAVFLAMGFNVKKDRFDC